MYPVPRMSPAEGEAWLGLVRVCELLPSELDSQLQRDADMTHYEFAVLTFLRWAPDASVSMSEIADAHRYMEANRAVGKLVVLTPDD